MIFYDFLIYFTIFSSVVFYIFVAPFVKFSFIEMSMAIVIPIFIF